MLNHVLASEKCVPIIAKINTNGALYFVLVHPSGIGPLTSSMSRKRSTTELWMLRTHFKTQLANATGDIMATKKRIIRQRSLVTLPHEFFFLAYNLSCFSPNGVLKWVHSI